MSKSAQRYLAKTEDFNGSNLYIKALSSTLKDHFFSETQASQWKGKWRDSVFQSQTQEAALHLEIGTGKGKHFAELCFKKNQDYCIGIEIKYKPLVQTIKAFKKLDCENAKVIRYNARHLEDLFETKELNDIYIYFPDPWPKMKARKHRLLTLEFAEKTYRLQKQKSLLKLRMDSLDYFLSSVEHFKKAGYNMIEYTEDLYEVKNQSDFKANHKLQKEMTQFEWIFFQKQVPIKHATFLK